MKIIDLNDGNLNLPPVEDRAPESKPPVAVDFTDNPFSEVDPVALPSETEKEDVWENMRKRFKLVHEEIKKGGELDGSKIKLVEDGSEMAANVLSALLGLLFSLMGEEYTVLAPSKDISYKIILPAARIWARHSKIAGEISPDYVDGSACLAAVAEYTRTVIKGIREIRWMKANGYVYVGEHTAGVPYEHQSQTNAPTRGVPSGRVGYEYGDIGGFAESPPQYEATARQDGVNSATAGQPPVGGYPADGSQPRSGLGTIGTVLNEGLTDEQRRAHDKLLELSRRDLTARKRRAGQL